ncbi:hypothetical protein GCM10025879_14980 [Leuconostoc litchii]|uniref:Uncharacterized protein n=1 Tax=Leuconostoc litchii TaxID=1981069 RepID=A0A652NE50_9LACO|nr:hypothetical protein [Leuconostoc litchii]TYC46441.1 hypothetical protein ESZ47_06205 [Leuconostoc litchii]GMA70252.1 hypothetical protein GCM10025879_14980 [Leuconostoc litchii]
MQNYIVQHQFQAPLHHILQKLSKYFRSKPSIFLHRQLNADEIIVRLELALNTTRSITIQLNESLLSEKVTQLSGHLYQNSTGQLFISSSGTHQLMSISPASIRHIMFNQT